MTATWVCQAANAGAALAAVEVRVCVVDSIMPMRVLRLRWLFVHATLRTHTYIFIHTHPRNTRSRACASIIIIRMCGFVYVFGV
jgi:hypothetical protein